jgi:hypothetical protein
LKTNAFLVNRWQSFQQSPHFYLERRTVHLKEAASVGSFSFGTNKCYSEYTLWLSNQ